MFTEYEIETMMEIPEIKEANFSLKKEFIKSEAPYLEISDHDFFSLVMMTPTLGMALADGTVSLFEELALNKKARKLSKGGYFMKKDPVVYAMKFLLKGYDKWSDKFLKVLRMAVEHSLNYEGLEKLEAFEEDKEITYQEYKKEVLRTPYILIRFIASFFLENEEDVINSNRTMRRTEYKRMIEIGDQLGIKYLPVFHMFVNTFKIK